MIIDLTKKILEKKFMNPINITLKLSSQKFKIHYHISQKESGNYPHLGISAREGLHIMYKHPDKHFWLNLEAYARASPVSVKMSNFLSHDTQYEIIIYGPILAKLDMLKIEIDDNDQLSVINYIDQKNVLVVGGLNSFGIGCTTVGTMFSNILSRKTNTNINHLTFNDYNYLPKVKETLKNLNYINYDMVLFELDYVNQNDVYVEKYLLDTVSFFYKSCEKVIGWYTIPDKKKYKIDKIHELLKNNSNIIIEDLSCLHSKRYSQMCTYSNNFINDSGNMMIYKKLKKYF